MIHHESVFDESWLSSYSIHLVIFNNCIYTIHFTNLTYPTYEKGNSPSQLAASQRIRHFPAGKEENNKSNKKKTRNLIFQTCQVWSNQPNSPTSAASAKKRCTLGRFSTVARLRAVLGGRDILMKLYLHGYDEFDVCIYDDVRWDIYIYNYIYIIYIYMQIYW